MSQINYPDKIENSGANADGKVSASNMNEIKSVININETQQINGDITTLNSSTNYTDLAIKSAEEDALVFSLIF